MERDTGESIDHGESDDRTDDAPTKRGSRRGFYPADRLQGSPRASFAGSGRGTFPRS